MFTGIFIMAILLAGFVVLLRQAGSARHPLLQRLREKVFGRAELNCCCAADRRSSVPVS